MGTQQPENDTISVSSAILPFEEELNEDKFQGIGPSSDTITNEIAGAVGSPCSEENYEESLNSLKCSTSAKDAISKLSSEELLSLFQEELKKRNGASFLRSATTSLLLTQTGHTGTQEEFMFEESSLGNASAMAITGESQEFHLSYHDSIHREDETVTGSCKSFQKKTCIGKIKPLTDTSYKLQSLISMDPNTSTITKDSVSKLENAITQHKNKNLTKKTIEIFRERQQLLQKLIVDNSTLDVAFLVDCTKSMDPYINQTKADVEHVVNEIKRVFENDVKVAFVGYRDHKDGPKKLKVWSSQMM